MSAQSVVPPVASPAPESPPRVPLQAYFELERTSEMRHEYVEGELIPMAGETLTHNRIALNISIALDRVFEERDCSVCMEGVRVRVTPERYRYPDIVALCGEPILTGDNPTSMINPALIVEVLSPSTQATDRGEKFFEYQTIASLTDYVLASQDRVSVFHWVRQNDRQWMLTEYTDLSDALTFAALDARLSLADVYRKVTFAP